jgi:hypothetical protein
MFTRNLDYALASGGQGGVCQVEKNMPLSRHKARGGIIWEIIIYAICFLILSAAVVASGAVVINLVKTSQTKSEMSLIAEQCQNYSGLRKDGKLPANLEILLNDTAITAGESITGQAYGNFLSNKNSRWSGGQVVDMWDTEYEYTANSDGTGSIISTGSGTSIEVDF